jgi:hypothetical protein
MTEDRRLSAVASDHSIAELLGSLLLAPRQAHAALTLWPLLRTGAGGPAAPECATLAEALEAGSATLDEASAEGFVPHACIENRGKRPVLILFGEELIGAMQNRVANASFLVASGARVVLDVSCVEHGRWSRRSGARFRAGEQVVSHDLRRKMQRKVARAVAMGGRFEADQTEVWDEVASRITGAQALSASGAYQDYTAARERDVAPFLESFCTVEHQVGFVAAIRDTVVGLEAVATPALLRKLFGRLLRGYAVDALDPSIASRPRGAARRSLHAFRKPEPFLHALARARCVRRPSLGMGNDLRLEGKGVSGCALEAGGIVHLTAFADAAY